MKSWIERYVRDAGNAHLRRVLETGHDAAALVRWHAVRRWFPGGWCLSGAAWYEERVSPRAEALDLLEELKVAVQIVNEFQLGEDSPLRFCLVERVVRVHDQGARFTGCVAVAKMESLADLHVAWSAEGREAGAPMEPRGSIARSG